MRKTFLFWTTVLMAVCLLHASPADETARQQATKDLISGYLEQDKLTEALQAIRDVQEQWADQLAPFAAQFLQVGTRLRNSDLSTSLELIDTGLQYSIKPEDYKSLYRAIHIKFVDGGMTHGQLARFLQEMQEQYGTDERIAAQIAQKRKFLDFLGKDAPEITAEGTWVNVAQPLSLKGLRGKYILLDFFAPWCPDCRRSLPGYLELADKLKGKLAAVMITRLYGFYADETTKPLRDIKPVEEKKYLQDYIQRKNITIPVFVGVNEEVYQTFAASAIPHYVLISPEGRVEQLCMEQVHDFFNRVEEIVNSAKK
jgi:thiol-disulfide isomerase/thioredoxin